MSDPTRSSCIIDSFPAKSLQDRVEHMLATYERRQTTNVPGTISLIRDLAAALNGTWVKGTVAGADRGRLVVYVDPPDADLGAGDNVVLRLAPEETR